MSKLEAGSLEAYRVEAKVEMKSVLVVLAIIVAAVAAVSFIITLLIS